MRSFPLIHWTTVFLTTIPGIFEGTYHQPVGIAGLHYFALGVGLTGASQLNARMLDRIYKYFQEKNGGVGKPEYRLRVYPPLFLYVGRQLTKSCSVDGTWGIPTPRRPAHHRLDCSR